MPLYLNIWYCNTQDWALEATKSYEAAFIVEYKLNL